jgi:hypothetical protein
MLMKARWNGRLATKKPSDRPLVRHQKAAQGKDSQEREPETIGWMMQAATHQHAKANTFEAIITTDT